MPRIAVIIPAKNEAENIGRVLEDVRRHLPEADRVVVDDNSQDATGEVASSYPGTIVLRVPVTLGIGGAVQLGVKYCYNAGYDVFIRMDGDGQHTAECLPSLLQSLRQATLIQGSRSHSGFLGTSNFMRKVGSLYFCLLFRLFTSKRLPDPTSGLICFGRDIAGRFAAFFPSEFPEIESEVLLLRAGYDILPVSVTMRSRQGGRSSIDFVHAFIYMFSVTAAFFVSFLRKNPYNARTAI